MTMNSNSSNRSPALVLDLKTKLLCRFLIDIFIFFFLRVFIRNYLLKIT